MLSCTLISPKSLEYVSIGLFREIYLGLCLLRIEGLFRYDLGSILKPSLVNDFKTTSKAPLVVRKRHPQHLTSPIQTPRMYSFPRRCRKFVGGVSQRMGVLFFFGAFFSAAGATFSFCAANGSALTLSMLLARSMPCLWPRPSLIWLSDSFLFVA